MARPSLFSVLTLGSVLIAALSAPLAAQKDGEKGGGMKQQQAIVQLEQRWLAAEDDPDTLETILAPDFVHVLPAGFVTRAEQLRFMRTHPAPKRGPRHFESLSVRIYGTVAIANGMVIATGADGKQRKTLFTDVFAYRDGKWQAVNAQELPYGETLQSQR